MRFSEGWCGGLVQARYDPWEPVKEIFEGGVTSGGDRFTDDHVIWCSEMDWRGDLLREHPGLYALVPEQYKWLSMQPEIRSWWLVGVIMEANNGVWYQYSQMGPRPGRRYVG